jgi:hypothetical protein
MDERIHMMTCTHAMACLDQSAPINQQSEQAHPIAAAFHSEHAWTQCNNQSVSRAHSHNGTLRKPTSKQPSHGAMPCHADSPGFTAGSFKTAAQLSITLLTCLHLTATCTGAHSLSQLMAQP